jgi:hypothetical protein
LVAQVQPRTHVEPGHRANSIYAAAVQDGWTAEGLHVAFPEPRLKDGLDPAAERSELVKLAGSEQVLEDLLRDSVTAPFILKVRDQKGADATIRIVDLWFAVRGNLDEFDPFDFAKNTSGKAAEAGNMRFESRVLTESETKGLDRPIRKAEQFSRWFAQVKGRLLDRITFQVTDETVATRTGESLVIAGRTDPAFDRRGPQANQWQSIDPDGRPIAEHRYAGGMSYAKISRLKQPAGILFVEFHGAFCEPEPWFGGAPILRSKFAPITQDQVRKLRRELLKRQPKTGRPIPATQ